MSRSQSSRWGNRAYHGAFSQESRNDLYMSVERDEQIKQVLRKFILESIALRNLRDDDDLFESGIVNSLFAVQLMTFIEKTFHIEIGVDDLDIQNFKSVNAAASFVLRRDAVNHTGTTT